MKKMHLVCNAHLDPVWLWQRQEGIGEALSTYRIAADFCENYDGFVFNHNEAVLYEWVEEFEPVLFKKWLENSENYKITKEVYDELDYTKLPKQLVDLKDYIVSRTVWTIGGDGWAYDIGYGGIDHLLASHDNVNILVLDSEVYSNTGGQSSKASPIGTHAAFTSMGKQVAKKDLAKIAMSYPHVYVAQTSIGANAMQTIKCFSEAAAYDGPSIIIAYTPCISHGIKGGMGNSINESKQATLSGYFPTFRFNPTTEKFTLDSKNVNFDNYEEFLLNQNRYSVLKKLNPDHADTLLKLNKEYAIKRYEYFKELNEKK
jgi:pyruvate-ferredoxin/flavodoxin oxidoreductase